VTIHEVGLDGFWFNRLLDANGVESHVVDPAVDCRAPTSPAAPRRIAIDGETLLRTLMAWKSESARSAP